MDAVEISPSLRADLEDLIEATGPLEDADPEFQDLVSRVRAATVIPSETLEASGLRLALRALLRADMETSDAMARLSTISLGLNNRMKEIREQIRVLQAQA
jgi:hypothetical protein